MTQKSVLTIDQRGIWITRVQFPADDLLCGTKRQKMRVLIKITRRKEDREREKKKCSFHFQFDNSSSFIFALSSDGP